MIADYGCSFPVVSDKIVEKLGIKIKPFKGSIDIIDASAGNLYTAHLPVESSSNQTKSPSDQAFILKPVAVKKLCKVWINRQNNKVLVKILICVQSFVVG